MISMIKKLSIQLKAAADCLFQQLCKTDKDRYGMITLHIIFQFYTKLRFPVLIFMKDIYCTGGIIFLYRKNTVI